MVEHCAFQFLHEALLLPEELLCLVFPQHLDIRCIQHTVLHGLGGAQHVTTDDEINLVAELGKIGGILACGVAAAYHGHVFAFIEEAVAGGASRDAATLELLFGGESEVTR